MMECSAAICNNRHTLYFFMGNDNDDDDDDDDDDDENTFMIYAVCFYDSQCFLCIVTRKYINDYNVSHIALYRLIQGFIDYTVIKYGCPLNQPMRFDRRRKE